MRLFLSSSMLTGMLLLADQSPLRMAEAFLTSPSNNRPSQILYSQSIELTKEMNSLADQCVDMDKPVVALASQVEDMYNDGITDKDVVSFNVVLKAWAKVAHSMQQKKRFPSKNPAPFDMKADVPSVQVYTPRDAAEHATKLLMEAEESFTEDPDNAPIVPNEMSYNIAIDAWAKSAAPDSTKAAERLLARMVNHDRVTPSSISYNAVLDAHVHAPDAGGSLDRMNKIWKHMQESSNEKVQPSLNTVNMILSACAKKSDANSRDAEAKFECAQQAIEIFNDLKNGDTLEPDVSTYTIVMGILSRVGKLEATQMAEDLLKELKQKYEETGDEKFRPNKRTYTALVQAWGRTVDRRSSPRAFEVLQEMKDLYEVRKNNGTPIGRYEETTKPNGRTYTAAMHSLIRSNDPNKATRALNLLREMRTEAEESPDCAPTIQTFNVAIEVCSRTRGDAALQSAALKIAFAILKTVNLDDNCNANGQTFSNLLKVVGSLLPLGDDRNNIAKSVFEKARASGAVNGNVVKTLRHAVDNQTFRSSLIDIIEENGYVNYDNIPAQWSKNAR